MKNLNKKGFSLIEVICAGAILSIVSLFIVSSFFSSLEVYKSGNRNYSDVNSYVNKIENKSADIDENTDIQLNINDIEIKGNYRYTKDKDGKTIMAEFIPEKNSIPEEPEEPGILSGEIFICAWRDGMWAFKPKFNLNWESNWIQLNGQGIKGTEYIILDGYIININKNWDDVLKEAISSPNQGTHIIKGDVYKDDTGVYVVKNDQWVSKYSAISGIEVNEMAQNVQRIFTDRNKVWKDEDYSYSDWYGNYIWTDPPVYGAIYIPNLK